ncbi:glycosyltransferase [Pseudarthrobacter quantipunctorum]|uniref:Glycosyltransferase n=1 Tax=Pseudarthrobacter quantipunctorum TaxID=3128980 RepID=A0ABZ2RAR7_9MICC
MSVAAVVVSFNRVEYLKKCMLALTRQTRKLDEIIVVENGSTDGSAEFIRANYPGVTLHETGENLGGAGGFALGVDIAIANGHESAWLMDDDAEPHNDAVEHLCNAMKNATRRPGFVTSLVVNDQGIASRDHTLDVSNDTKAQLEATNLDAIAVSSASFVGVLIDLQLAARQPLPYSDFFIWLDDVEYTRRLASQSGGLCIPLSKIKHPEKNNRTDLGGRLFFFIRNSIWLSKLKTNRTTILDRPSIVTLAMLGLSLKQLKVTENKKQWLRCSATGLWQGVFSNPKVDMPGSLVSKVADGNVAPLS